LAERGYDLAAADIAHSMLSRARERFGDSVRWNLLEPDWTRLPFDDQAFDAIVASSVLEYVGDTDAVLAEWARVLRHGGVLLVTVPNSRHPVRVLERLLAGTARSKAIGGVARLSDRIHAYFEYLRLSKNRYTRAKWHRVARDHGFCPLAPFPLPSGSLDLLGYHRS
jgi:ubiquinone/menaquinone biosynthesis C-methylase UbiE